MDHTIKKPIYALAILWLLSFQCAIAQLQNNQAKDTITTILFKVTSPHTDNVSYLFGTHHAFGKEFFDSLNIAHQALASSEIVIKENLNIPGQTAQDIINRRTNTTPWNKYLSNQDLAYIKNLFATSPTDYNKMTPTEMYTFLNRHFKQQVCLNKAADDTSLSLDDYIATKAVEQNIPLYGLETTQQQITLLNKDVEGLPQKNHKRRLSNIIKKIKNKNINDCEETKWYAHMAIHYQLQAPCRNHLILTDRNALWMAQITQKLQEKKCFIAVGLSHLMYSCGLINQLTQLGYTVTPVYLK